MNLFTSRKEFVRRLWNAIGVASAKLGLTGEIGTAQKTILVAQAVHESGWGIAKAAKHAFNYWNLTAGSRWKGPVLLGPDTEYDAAGKVKRIEQKFRVYRSDEESAIDMLKFIGPGTRYAKAWTELLKGDAMAYVKELYAAGYFTQPLPLYQEGMRKTVQSVIENKEGTS